MIITAAGNLCGHSKELQVPSNGIHQALRRRSNTKNRQAAGVDLRPSRVGDDLCRDTNRPCGGAQRLELILALSLDSNLGLSVLFPAGEYLSLRGRRTFAGRGAREGLVACECCVGALGCDLACERACQVTEYLSGSERQGVGAAYLWSCPSQSSRRERACTPPCQCP